MNTSLSHQIRACREGVVKNPFQGNDKKVLFVCSMGILRSATGARLYSHKYNTRSAGTWDDALIPLTPLLMEWADEVVFVNETNYQQVKKFYLAEDIDIDKEYSIKVLNIPDAYPHMHPNLIAAFHAQYEKVNNTLYEQN